MSKMMGMVIGAVDSFMPGYKTYVVWVCAMGMMVCQMFGFHGKWAKIENDFILR